MVQKGRRESKRILEGFDSPTRLPRDETQRERWQAANQTWWELHPMRYDWDDRSIASAEFTKEFFAATDQRFFAAAKHALGWKQIPFDTIIDFDLIKDRSVLEVGVGLGSHAQLLASRAKSYTGIDITLHAVKATSERLRAVGLDGASIMQMDAEDMKFADDSFDYIWSWGVIHHSADTERVLREIQRVLRPGGIAVAMVYHRGYNYYVRNGLIRGFLKGHLFESGTLHQIVQRHIDGAIARHYSIAEWKTLVAQYFNIRRIRTYGSKLELVSVPGWRAKRAAMRMLPDVFSRFLTTTCRLGELLVSHLEKGAPNSKEGA